MQNICIGFKARPQDAAQLVRFAQALGLRVARAWRSGHEVIFVKGAISIVTELMKRFCLSHHRLLSSPQPDGTYRIVDKSPKASKGCFLDMEERERRCPHTKGRAPFFAIIIPARGF